MIDRHLRVAIDCRMARHSGIGTVIRALVPRLVRLHPEWEFRLLGRPSAWEPELPASASVRDVALNAPIYSSSEQLKLRRAAKGANVFWSPHYNAAVFAGVPLVTTVHDVTHLAFAEFTAQPHKRLYARLMYEAVRRRSSALLFVSQFTRDEFERCVGKLACPSWIAYNAVGDFWRGRVPPSEPPIEGDYLVFVGNFKPHKNLGRLIEALSRVRQRYPIRLVVIGRTEGFITADEPVLALARSMPEAVVLAGETSDELMRRYLMHARAMVFPSLYEGFGLPPLEAMAVGCPNLVSDAASMPEVCGDAAAYFNPTEVESIVVAIERLLSDPDLAPALRARGLERVAMFNWDATAEVLARALEQAAR